MREPRRLVHSDGPGAQLLSAARAYRPPSASRRRVQRMLGLPVVLSLGATLSAALASTSAKVLLVAAALTATTGGGMIAYRAATRHPAVPVQRSTEVNRVRAPAPLPAPNATGMLAPSGAADPAPPRRPRKHLTKPPPRRLAAVAPRSAARVAFSSNPPPAAAPPRPEPRIAIPSEPLPGVAPSRPEPRIGILSEPLPAVAPFQAEPGIAQQSPPAAAPPAARAPAPSLAAELALLEEAESAIRKRRCDEALARLQEHRMAFPDSALAEEAAVLRIAALFGAGQRAVARAEAARFLTRSSSSLLADRVRSLLAADPHESNTSPKGDQP